MKKKTKRYQAGGETEDKRRGLAASKGEKVGFFERLRMGNIDDPKSEAYKRFGAGRGQAETAKERAAIKAYKGPSEADFGTPDSPSPFTGSTGSAKPTPAKAPAKAKPAIVTKEQLKASGFDNLRDYLNAQRGLTRRGESAPRKAAAAAPRGSYRGTQEEGNAGEDEARKALAERRAKEREIRNRQTDPGLTPGQAKSQRDAEMKRDAAKTGSQRLAEKADRAGNIYQRSRDAQKKKDEERKMRSQPRGRMKAADMASGGSVSSASKRADGIAVRGKTRCKVM